MLTRAPDPGRARAAPRFARAVARANQGVPGGARGNAARENPGSAGASPGALAWTIGMVLDGPHCTITVHWYCTHVQ